MSSFLPVTADKSKITHFKTKIKIRNCVACIAYLVRYNQVEIFDLFFARNRDFRPDEISEEVCLFLSQLLFKIKWQTVKKTTLKGR